MLKESSRLPPQFFIFLSAYSNTATKRLFQNKREAKLINLIFKHIEEVEIREEEKKKIRKKREDLRIDKKNQK